MARLQTRVFPSIFCLWTIYLLLGEQSQVASSLRVEPTRIEEREGDEEVHFFCLEGQGGSQARNITWRDPHGNLYTPGSPTEGGSGRVVAEGYRLSVFDLVRGDSGSYECFRGSASANGELFVFAQPVILNPMPIQEIYFGMTSLLACQIDRGNPSASVYWLHVTYNQSNGDQIIEVITASWDPRFTIVEGGLEIRDVRASDEGVYRCYVQNNRGLDVLDIRASFRESPQFVDPEVDLEVVVKIGDSVLLDCTAAGAPSPNTTWTLPPNSKLGQGAPLTNSTLDVLLSDGTDVGEYSCTVENEAGSISRNFTVKLAIPPEPAVKYRNMTIELGKEMRINCSVTALPRPLFRWLLGTVPLPASSWDSAYDGISTLVYAFGQQEIDSNCKIRVVCVATNSYGQSKQHFILTPSSKRDCPQNQPVTPTFDSTPLITLSGEQGQVGSEGVEEGDDGKMSGTTFKIIIGSFTVAATVVVIGVIVLLVYFIRHFCSKKKFSGQLKSANSSCLCQHPSSTLPEVGGAFSATSSLQIGLDGTEVICTGEVNGQRRKTVGFCTSADNHNNVVAPPISLRPPPPNVGGGAASESIYHRLDHKLPYLSSQSSFASSASTHSRTRLLSSCSTADSNSVFLASQISSTGDPDDGTGSVFFVGEPQKRLNSSRQVSRGADGIECSFAAVSAREDSLGMVSNPSYEQHKLKISTSSSDEPPHVYEKVS